MTKDKALEVVVAAVRFMLAEDGREVRSDEKLQKDFGFDSMDTADLIFRLEAGAEVTLADEDWDLLDQPETTVSDVADLLVRRTG